MNPNDFFCMGQLLVAQEGIRCAPSGNCPAGYFFTRVLSAVECQAVTFYLAARYGITLSP